MPSRKTSIIQSLLGKVRSWVTNSFQSLDHCDLRIKTQEPVEDEDCCALANHGGEEEANTLDLRASQTCFSSRLEQVALVTR